MVSSTSGLSLQGPSSLHAVILLGIQVLGVQKLTKGRSISNIIMLREDRHRDSYLK